MNLVANVLAGILAAVCLLTAFLDLTKNPAAFATTRRLRIPDNMVPVLGLIKLAAAIGLGIGFASVGMAKLVGVCLCIYFAVATVTHTRVKDSVANTAPAFVLTAMSVLYVLTTFAK